MYACFFLDFRFDGYIFMMKNSSLPKTLYSCEYVRAIDAAAIAAGTPGVVLMKRAARAAFELLLRKWPHCSGLIVLCGAGNNAGDGYVLAGLAAQECIAVTVWYVSSPDALRGDALKAYRFAMQEGVVCKPFDNQEVQQADLYSTRNILVDALLGIGLNKVVRDSYAEAIHWVNNSSLPVLALDVPSGLCANTGRVLGCAVNASVTITFIGIKKGLLTGQAANHVGLLQFSDLGVLSESLCVNHPFNNDLPIQRLEFSELLASLPLRQASDHKGNFGHLILIGGDSGMGGAILMAAESSFCCGIGLVSIITHRQNVTAALIRLPEAMAHGVSDDVDKILFEEVLGKATALVVGPGIGRRSWAALLVNASLECAIPIVLDADGLNLLADGSTDVHFRDNWVLTPHPGEAARLLKTDIATIEQDRFAAVTALQQKYGGVVVLKGAGTLVANHDGIFVCTYGNSSMATAGMGDVLSGIIGGLLAQGVSCVDAACLGVCIHALAGDEEVSRNGRIGLRSTGLFPCIRYVLNTDLYHSVDKELI